MSHLRAAVVPVLFVLSGFGVGVSAAEKPVAPVAAPEVAAPDSDLIAITLFNGLEYQGIVQRSSDAQDLELLTVYGTLSFHRTDIVKSRKELSDSEKASIRVAVRDADAHRRLASDRQLAIVEREVSREPGTPRHARNEEGGVSRPQLGVARFSETSNWMERMDRQLNKPLTLDLQGDSLTDTISLISSITGLNIIINPKVQQANPTITLRIKDMDAGTAIRWITQLTETYAEVKDHAIYITDKPSPENADAEKIDAAIMAASVGADITLPADGTPLTDDDRIKIARAIMAKETPKVQDFPGPDMGLGTLRESTATPFAPAP